MIEDFLRFLHEISDMLGTWAISRSSGITAFLLFGVSAIAGMLSAMKSISPITKGRWNVLHQWTGWYAWIMTGLHLLAIWFDTYTEFTWKELLVPFSSDEDRLANGFGTIGFYALSGILISSDGFRRTLPRIWKVIHISAFPAFFVLLAHALWIGTDNHKWIVVGAYLTISVLFIILAWWRQKPEDQDKVPTKINNKNGVVQRSSST